MVTKQVKDEYQIIYKDGLWIVQQKINNKWFDMEYFDNQNDAVDYTDTLMHK